MSSFDSSDSGEQSNIIVSLIIKIFNFKNVSLVSLIVRKTAHFTEYFILGILSLNCYKDYCKNKRIILFSIVFCILYAMLDEFHQTFIPGRVGTIKDVLIDSMGVLCGVTAYYYLKLKKVFNDGRKTR